MTRNLKALGLGLLAVFALGALAAQGAAAHEFHASGEKVASTGVNTNPHELAIGTKGSVKCESVNGEATHTFTEVGAGTYARDTLTVAPHYKECTFGGAAASINFNHCAYVVDSDTAAGNPTGGEHVNVEIECEGSVVEIATSTCTFTIPPQLIKDAARLESDPENENRLITTGTGHEIEVSNLNNKAGCVLFPKGKVGKYVGSVTVTCFKDEGSKLEGTEKTTPTEKLVEGSETQCKIAS